jgi:hypothetical protein
MSVDKELGLEVTIVLLGQLTVEVEVELEDTTIIHRLTTQAKQVVLVL